jgi:predicted phosphodiesterase
MKNTIKDIKGDIIAIYEDGGFDSYGIKAQAATYIMKQTGLKKTAAKDWAKRIYDECILMGSVDEVDEPTQPDLFDEVFEEEHINPEYLNSDLEFSDKYVYNKGEDEYIFLMDKRFGKNVKLEGSSVRSLIKNYSNFDGNPDSLNKVSNNYGIPRNILIAILKIMGITHDSLPCAPEEIAEKSIETLRDECLMNKRFALAQEIQKADWKETEKAAKEWNAFKLGKFNPFVEAIDTWEAPTMGYIDTLDVDRDDKTFMVILTDTHIGELVKHTWEGKTFNSQKAVANIISYLTQIAKKLSERKVVPSECKLVIMGDILNSFVDGMTRKGTKLHNDIINADLFKVGLDVIVTFVQTLRSIFESVDISCVKGNHDSELIYAVYYSASRYFENDDNIKWKISDYWLDSFRVNNSYFIYSHGKDDVNHIGLPATNGKKFESFVQSLLLARAKSGELMGVESKYFISGHLHSYQHNELNDFEQIQVPASVDADDFAESLGFRSRARQNCFIVGKDHIEDTLHFFFD